MPQIFLGSIDDREIKQITDIQKVPANQIGLLMANRIVFVSPCLPTAKLTGKPEPYSVQVFLFYCLRHQIISHPIATRRRF
jgi:hypothetical protein